MGVVKISSEKKFECIIYEKKDNSAWITLNRPEKLNALSTKTWIELAEAIEIAENDPEVYVIVLTGKGRAFCAGDDISDLKNLRDFSTASEYFSVLTEKVLKILQCKKPLIAAVNGLAYGGGCELVELADMAVAVEDARFCVPEGLIGAVPPIHVAVAPLIFGRKIANEMAYTAEPIDAKKALEIGLVNKVVPKDKLEEAVIELIGKIKRVSPPAIITIKRITLRQFISPNDLATAISDLLILAQTNDFKEGMAAFLEKRQPKWAGK